MVCSEIQNLKVETLEDQYIIVSSINILDQIYFVKLDHHPFLLIACQITIDIVGSAECKWKWRAVILVFYIPSKARI